MEVPGWNSIETTGALSNFFFFLSIGALLLLGMSEVAQHFYGQRHDGLVAQKNQTEKDASDGEIARLHRDTAEANKAAAEAKLELAKITTPRTLSTEQQEAFINELKPFVLTANIIVPPPSTADTAPLASLLDELLKKADWKVGFINALGGWVKTVLVCIGNQSPPKTKEAATKMVLMLRAAGIQSFIDETKGPRIEATGMGEQLPNPDMTILVGAKE